LSVLSSRQATIVLSCAWRAGCTLRKVEETEMFNTELGCEKPGEERNSLRMDGDAPMGLELASQGRFEEAVGAFERQIETNPCNASAHLNLGTALRLAGRRVEAVQALEKALTLQPCWPTALYNMGATLFEIGDLAGSLGAFRETVALQPDWGLAHEALGMTLLQQGHLEEARASLQEALGLAPDSHLASHYLGLTHLHFGETESAISTYLLGLSRNSSCPHCHLALGLSFLACGAYTEGWKEYEWRWKTGGETPQLIGLDRPVWDGEPLEGKTILLWAEQGFGDIIYFIRFATILHERGATVWLLFPSRAPQLSRLIATCSGVSRVFSSAEDLDEFDYQLPLGSLPGRLGITPETLSVQTPYLTPPSGSRTGDPFGPRRGGELRVGLVWGVEPGHPNWQERSCPISAFRLLESVPGVALFSFQFGPRAAELCQPDSPRMADLSAVLGDFANTAALIDHLDLVITVDTAIAHLAGAIGKPVWTLLHHHPDWRWQLRRDDTPWYPTMRLFRQREPGRWEPVIERVVAALRELRQEGTPQ
jgi:tetratricopeptide (TPR) repeat protein